MPRSPRSPAPVFAQAVPRAGNALPHHVHLETPARPSGPSPALPGLPAATGLLPRRPPSPDLEESACHIGWSSARVSSCLRRETCLFTGGATTWLTAGAPGVSDLVSEPLWLAPPSLPKPKAATGPCCHQRRPNGPHRTYSHSALCVRASLPELCPIAPACLRGRVRHRDPQLMLLGGR